MSSAILTEADITNIIRAYLVANGIDQAAASRVTAMDVLAGAREQQEKLLADAAAAAAAANPLPAIEKPPSPPPVVEKDPSPPAPNIPAAASPTAPPACLPSASPPRSPKRALDEDASPAPSPKRRKSSSPARPLPPPSQVAALTPSKKAIFLNPTQAYGTFMSHFLVYLSLCFAAACTMLMRQKRVGDALAIGRYAVDFLGPEAWYVPIPSHLCLDCAILCRRTAVLYFDSHDVHFDSTKEAKLCLGDCLEHIRAFDRDLGRKLHRVMAESAMRLKAEMNVQG